MFLPISKAELLERNIEQLDFIIISGDAYVCDIYWDGL